MVNDYLVRRVFRQYLLASIVALMAATLGMTIDNILAGQLIGSNALGAMSLVQPLFLLLTVVGGILASGGGVLAARYIGANQRGKVCNVFTIVMLASLGVAALITAGCLGFAPQITRLLGASDPELYSMTLDYIRGLMLGAIPITLTLSISGFIRVDGSAKLSMLATVSMGAANIVLDILFAGVLDLGTLGLASATSLSYVLALLIALLHFRKKENTLRLVRPTGILREIKETCASGLPHALNSGCQVVRGIILNYFAFALGGVSALNALTVQNSLRVLLNTVTMGIGYTIAPMIGIFFGEKDGRAIGDTVKLSIKTGLLLCCTVAAAMFALARPAVSLFNAGDAHAVEMAVFAVRMFVLSMPLNMLNNLFMYYYQSVGKLWLANVICAARALIFAVAFVFATSGILGINAIWLSLLAADALTTITLFLVILWRAGGRLPRLKDFLALSDDCYAQLPTYEISIRNNVGDVLTLSRDIQAFCAEHEVNTRTAYFTALCVEEMAGNVVKHGFSDQKEHFLDIKVMIEGDKVHFRLRDDGISFDPFDYLTRSQEEKADDRAANIGIRLVKAMAEEVDYRNSVGLNNLFVTV